MVLINVKNLRETEDLLLYRSLKNPFQYKKYMFRYFQAVISKKENIKSQQYFIWKSGKINFWKMVPKE